MPSTLLKAFLTLVFLAAAASLGWELRTRLLEEEQGPSKKSKKRPPAPVEVAPIRKGSVTLRRVFSGSLDATESFSLTPRMSGRITKIAVDAGDLLKRGDPVVWIDDAEALQNVAQAAANLKVAEATAAERQSALTVAKRTLERIRVLSTEGVESASELEETNAQQLARAAQLDVAKANVTRAEAALAAANIRLGYAKVAAHWEGPDEHRIVGERFVDQGEAAGTSTPLLTVLKLDPITAVIFVPERDYPRLARGQKIKVATDAYPNQSFPGTVSRIAPLFRRSTRQARVELSIPNTDLRLKPGMFVRVAMELETKSDATLVPPEALTRRNDVDGVFIVDPTGTKALWRPVRIDIRERDRVAVEGEGLKGRVITIGQQLVGDGSLIVIPDAARTPSE